MEVIKVWTDGATFPNPGRGGWGWTTLNGRDGSGGLEHTTNQVMELTAVYEAVRSLYVPDTKILVITDSMYAINCATNWWHNWVTNGWVNSKGQPVKNRELIEEIISITWGKGVSFQWIKGHSGDPGNEEADRLATLASGAPTELIMKCKRNWHGDAHV